MLPEPHADALLPGVIDNDFSFLRAPPSPEALDYVVLKSELPRHTRKFPHAFHGLEASIEITPNGAAWLDPDRANSLGEKLRVGSRTQIGQDRTVDQRVQ